MAERRRLPPSQRNTMNPDGSSRVNASNNMTPIKKGMELGRSRARSMYGQLPRRTASQVQDIVRRRRSRMEGDDPSGTRLRESRNRQIRMARAQDASPEELAQIRRSAESDIAYEDFSRSGQALSDYQRLVGNILKGQQGMEMGYAGLEVGGQQPAPPSSTGSGLGTVICTELYFQGYMDYDTYRKDREYGRKVISEKPEVYLGYNFLAKPVVRLMKRSNLFTKLISYPAMKWADNMAGRYNTTGELISIVGEFICGLIGRCLYGQLQSSQVKA